MADLYPTLLKNVKHLQYGANLMNIVALQKKQGEVVKTKKLLVTYDGEEYAPVDCQSVTVKMDGDTIILNVVLAKDEDITDTKSTEAPGLADSVIKTTENDTFLLKGDDLESFEVFSEFRKKENRAEKEDSATLIEQVLDSGVFDIQDLTSVQNAILDIVDKEKKLIDQGYRVFKTDTPKFIYENNNNFKLTESVILIEPTKVTENK